MRWNKKENNSRKESKAYLLQAQNVSKEKIGEAFAEARAKREKKGQSTF